MRALRRSRHLTRLPADIIERAFQTRGERLGRATCGSRNRVVHRLAETTATSAIVGYTNVDVVAFLHCDRMFEAFDGVGGVASAAAAQELERHQLDVREPDYYLVTRISKIELPCSACRDGAGGPRPGGADVASAVPVGYPELLGQGQCRAFLSDDDAASIDGDRAGATTGPAVDVAPRSG